MFIETSAPRVPGHRAILQSGLFQGGSTRYNCMKFWYHMYGATIGTLNVWVEPQANISATVLWSLSGQQGNTWRSGVVPIPSQSGSYMVSSSVWVLLEERMLGCPTWPTCAAQPLCGAGCWSLLYSIVLCSQARWLHSHVILNEWLYFNSMFLNIHQGDMLTVLFGCFVVGAMWNCCRLSTFNVHHTTMRPVTSLQAKPHAEGACMFSCNLPPALLSEWQGSFMRYCGSIGWSRYKNKSQHKKLTLETNILQPLLPKLKPTTFQSQVWHSNHWAVPTPCWFLL